MKNNRTLSFIFIAAVYLAAIAVGICSYEALNFHFALSLLAADVIATVFVFVFSLAFGNASVYDPYWSVQPPVILTAFALHYGLNSFGVVLTAAVWFWAIRLTANWAYTFRGLACQDWRYTMLSEKTGALYPVVNFLGIHLVPTLVVYLCTLPAVFAIVYGWELKPLSAIFCTLSMLAATMQGIADVQMHRHRKRKSGIFIRRGLWKYSRHPNYLGEIMQWWGIALAVLVSSGAWQLLAGGICNTALFLFVSIPMADNRQSEKDGWEEYKKQTHKLLPIYIKQ